MSDKSINEILLNMTFDGIGVGLFYLEMIDHCNDGQSARLPTEDEQNMKAYNSERASLWNHRKRNDNP